MSETGCMSPQDAHVNARIGYSSVQTCRRGRSAARAAAIVSLIASLLVAGTSTIAAQEPPPATSPALTAAVRARSLAQANQLDAALAQAQEALRLAQEEFGSDHEYVGYIYDDLATIRYRLGRPKEALNDARLALEIVRGHRGEDAREYASVANNLATIYFVLGQFAEAEPLYQKAYRVFVSQLGPNDSTTIQAATNLGILYNEMSRLDDARSFLETALEGSRARYGSDSAAVARSQLSLAQVHLREERVGDAERAGTSAQAIASRLKPRDFSLLADAEVVLARVEVQRSQLRAAEARLRQVIRDLEAAREGESLAAAGALYNLAFVYSLRGQALEAEPILKRTLGLYRRVVGEQHPAVARTLHSLALVYQELGLLDEAEQFYQKAIEVSSATLGPSDPSVAATRAEYSLLLTRRGEPASALDQAREALQVLETLGSPWAIRRAYATSASGFALHKAGDLPAAASAFERATAQMAELRGPESSDLPPGLTELGDIYRKQKRVSDSERVLLRAIAIREKDFSATPSGLARSLSALARLRIEQQRPDDALELARRYVDIASGRLALAQGSLAAAASGEQTTARTLYEEFLAIAEANRSRDASRNGGLSNEMFVVSQYPHLTGTAAAISGMAARIESGNAELAQLIRQRQDVLEEWRILDHRLTEQLAFVDGTERADDPFELRERMSRLTDTIRKIDGRLQREFPKYAELTNPMAVEAEVVRPYVRPNEAVLVQVTADDATYLFLLRSDRLHLARTRMTKGALADAVSTLRRGLDLQSTRALPPFNVSAAYYLYQNLVKPFEPQLNGVRHIIFVPDGAMQNLPPSLLLATPAVSPPTRPEDHRKLDFLVKHYAFSVVPSVSSFVSLRVVGVPLAANEPLVGFGDPALQGVKGAQRGPVSRVVRSLVLGTDTDALLDLEPLPETREELRQFAKALKAKEEALHFRETATETKVKGVDLLRYRIVAFATHGLLAGEFLGLAEPALVLTPPKQASPADDGLLTASEVAQLRMNADWVLLSACNTAAPAGRSGAEGLSGLAKAFFYAGVRALLVSHWWVHSEASVEITTTAVSEFTENPQRGRAEALRLSMQKMVEHGTHPEYAHPVYWAPFVTVGEGG